MLTRFYLRMVVYFICFLISMYALSALDFNRLIKKGHVPQAQTLYLVLAMIMAYLLGQFSMSLIYYFQIW